MVSFHEYIDEYRTQLKKGYIKKAYQGLMEYLNDLRLYFKNNYPDYFISENIQNGYMDYTYFYCFPAFFKKRKLKIVVFFIHDTFVFEAWLAGYNKSVGKKYWKLFAENNWDKYPVAPSIDGVDHIINHVLTNNPDFSNLNNLTRQIERSLMKFIKDIEKFLSEH